MKRLAIGIGLAAVICASEAKATPIIVSANRFVVVQDIAITVPGPLSPSSAVGAFVDSIAANLGDVDVLATQSSDIQASAGLFAGGGGASVGFSVLEQEQVVATSFFDVFFDISTPHSFNLTGALTSFYDGGLGQGGFLLTGPTSFGFSETSNTTTPLASSGVLAPGSYRLLVFASMGPGTIEPDSFMGGSASFNFNFQIEEIVTTPEPATLALLALGLAALGFTTRGKRSE